MKTWGDITGKDWQLVPVIETQEVAFSEQWEGDQEATSAERLLALGFDLEAHLPDNSVFQTLTSFLNCPTALRRLAEHRLRDWRENRETPYRFHSMPLCGGYAVMLDGEVIIEPQCCVDLGDWFGWSDIAKRKSTYWHGFWIGHPALRSKYQDRRLHIHYDPEFEWEFSLDFESPFFSVCPDELLQKVEVALQGLLEFAIALEPFLRVDLGEESLEGAKHLAGLSGVEDSESPPS